jgi:hypothetical protein
MAISQNTLIGSTKQSVGGVTFTKWKGRNVIKAKAVSVANPRTPAQTANRNRFSGTSKFYSNFKSTLSLAFLRMMGNVTDGNKFASMNRMCFSTDVIGIDPAEIGNLRLAEGSLGSFSDMAASELSAGRVMIGGSYVSNPSKSMPTDMFRFVVFNETGDSMMFYDALATEGAVSARFAANFSAGDTVHSWVFSYSATGRLLSDSVYCGSFVAAL